jgi:hypothetical protein
MSSSSDSDFSLPGGDDSAKMQDLLAEWDAKDSADVYEDSQSSNVSEDNVEESRKSALRTPAATTNDEEDASDSSEEEEEEVQDAKQGMLFLYEKSCQDADLSNGCFFEQLVL